MNALEEFDANMAKLRSVSFCGFKGYQVDKILTIPTQEVLKGVFRIKFSQFCKNLLADILIEGNNYSFETIRNAKIVLFYSLGHAMRADYVRFMETIASCSDDAVLFTGKCHEGNLFSNLRFTLSSLKMPFLLLFWMIAFYKAGISKKYWRKYLCSLLSGYKWKCLLVKNQDAILSIKSMVSIFDAREHENIFAQFLKIHGIPTATLQHGHYGNEYYNDSQNFYIGIGYRGFVSDYFFAWGESSYNNAVSCGISPAKIIKAGCPAMINSVKIEGKKGAVGLLFDGGEEAILDNKSMYSIVRDFAKANGKKLLVKLHPSFQSSDYTFFIGDDNVELYSGDLESFAADVELAVCCNTSCLIMLLIWGHPLMHYAPIYMYDMYSELRKYSFSGVKELNNLYEKSVSPYELLSFYTEIGDVKGNYSKVFKNLINDNN